jgi:hypothetical protein
LNFYSEIWRTRKKTISALGFDRDLGFWPRSFVQICATSRQTCLGADYTWLTQLNKVFIFNEHLGCYKFAPICLMHHLLCTSGHCAAL